MVNPRQSRREFLGSLGGLGVGLALSSGGAVGFAPGRAHAMEGSNRFQLPTLNYGGDWDARLAGPPRLCWEVVKRTSIDAQVVQPQIGLLDDALFEHPMLYMFGSKAFPPWDENALGRLRRYLAYGGFLFIDGDGRAGNGFDDSVRRECGRLFPGSPLKRLDADHTVFKSFYLVDSPVGRTIHTPYLEGVDQDTRTMIVYGRNDMGGAWSRDSFGSWAFPVEPGGERQREMSFRMGVNIVMYALCTSYKSDQVHIPFIMKRRR